MITYNDLETAFLFSSGDDIDSRTYIDKTKGNVYFVSDYVDEDYPDDLEDNDNYVSVPSKKDLGLGKPLALAFAEATFGLDADNYETVEDIFYHKKAYLRFKGFLEKNQMLDAWYDFEATETKKAILAWCDETGILYSV